MDKFNDKCNKNIKIMIPGLLADKDYNIISQLDSDNELLYDFWYKNPMSDKSLMNFNKFNIIH
jgi:hypothetical protein